MNKILLILFLLLLNSCGYTSIYKNQKSNNFEININEMRGDNEFNSYIENELKLFSNNNPCLLYTSDAADDSLRVDLGGRRIIKK